MTKRMLIDATHAEETRVVVLDGNRLEDFDVETSTKKQLKGNIYLAKVVRVEPSLQAAFVEYGGGRHGFLAFGEIHPDYYQIPVADRQRLLALQAEEAREEAEAEEAEAVAAERGPSHQPARQHRPRPEVLPPIDPPDAEPRSAQLNADDGLTDDGLAGDALADGAQLGEPGADESDSDEPSAGGDDAGAAEASAHDSDEPGDEPAADPFAAPADDDARGDASPADAGLFAAAVETDAEAPAAPAPADAIAPDAIAPDAIAPSAIAPDEGPAAEVAQAELAQPEISEPGAIAATPDEAEATDGAPRPAQPALMAREERFGSADDLRDDIELPESDAPPPEVIGGENEISDSAEEARARRTSRFLRNYRIQEVIKRRQILLVQVVKEERGTKGAALTTYISLAGRFCVLMPNSPRGGGISRKITSASDRRRLKEITSELDIPSGMGLIVRTAGANRPKPEIKRDCEYLMRLWDDIREHTMRSVAPALIYEEASLIKRAIRDVYSRDIDEVLVDGEEGWKAAHDFMRMLMPSHAKKVQAWRGNGAALNGGVNLPLFAKYQVEAQLDGMLSPTVQLKSGGYLVINQTEALVAIDVNSGRSTRERGIEETALRTNLEAADEVARQLRLRDLAGLIVIDFIDMDAKKHNAMVERRIKDALKIDRARIQVGHISHFGLLEMSRQRLRPSLAETSFIACPHCGGLGHVRSTESSAIHVLRAIEEEGSKARASLIMVHAAGSVVMYLLNHKRARLAEIEAAYAMQVQFTADDSLLPPNIRIDRLRPQLAEHERPTDRPALAGPVAPAAPVFTAEDDGEIDADDVIEPEAEASAPAANGPAAPAEGRAATEEANRRRRRRRRRGRRDPTAAEAAAGLTGPQLDAGDGEDEAGGEETGDEAPGEDGAAEDGPAMTAGDAAGEPGAPHAEPVEAEAAAVDPAQGEQPSIDANELDEEGLPRPGRRRGRRGGRRRRRGEEGESSGAASDAEEPATPAPAAPAYVAPAYVAPAYTGPTPADPFGGGAFDIFDMMDMDGDAPPARPAMRVPPTVREAFAPPEPPPAASAAVTVEATRFDMAPPEAMIPGAMSGDTVPAPAAEPAAPEQTAVEAAAMEPVAPQSVAQETVAQEPAAPAPVAEQPVVEQPAAAAAPAEPVVGPAIQPIVLGVDEVPVVERKRGWWKR